MVVRVRGLCQSRVAVLLREQAVVIVGDFDRLVFEGGVAQWEEVLDLGVSVSDLGGADGGEC